MNLNCRLLKRPRAWLWNDHRKVTHLKHSSPYPSLLWCWLNSVPNFPDGAALACCVSSPWKPRGSLRLWKRPISRRASPPHLSVLLSSEKALGLSFSFGRPFGVVRKFGLSLCKLRKQREI